MTRPPRQQWTEGGPVKTIIESTEVQRQKATSEARIGEPGAMGLFGFCVGTTVIAWVLSGWGVLAHEFLGRNRDVFLRCQQRYRSDVRLDASRRRNPAHRQQHAAAAS